MKKIMKIGKQLSRKDQKALIGGAGWVYCWTTCPNGQTAWCWAVPGTCNVQVGVSVTCNQGGGNSISVACPAVAQLDDFETASFG